VKREEFEELVELLLDLLEAMEEPPHEFDSQHGRLRDWLKTHDARTVRAISNKIAMRNGWKGNTEGHPVQSLVPADHERFPTVIASFYSLARLLGDAEPNALLTFVPWCCSTGEVQDCPAIPKAQGLPSPWEILDRIKLFLPGLGEELSVLGETTKPSGKPDPKKTFDFLVETGRITKGISYRKAHEASKELEAEERGYVRFSHETAGKLLRKKWPDHYPKKVRKS